MATTTRPDFGSNTEALEVAQVFASSIKGKTILITGVNKDGIGYSTSYALASQSPKRLIIAGRSESKLSACISDLKADFPGVDYQPVLIDLSSQASVRSAAKTVLDWEDVPTIDIMINSAGVMGIQTRTLSPDGIEMHFATNHIGHFLLTNLLMPKIIEATKVNPRGATRIVNVSSLSPTVSRMRWSDLNFEVKNKDLPESEKPNFDWFRVWGYTDPEEMAYVPLDGYDRSKVANVLFGIGLNARLYEKYGIVSSAVHPGVIMTELGRNFSVETLEAVQEMMQAGHFSLKTLGAGAATSLTAALDPGLAIGCGGKRNWGSYLVDCQISGLATEQAMSSGEAERLWKVSEGLVKESFTW